MTAHFTPTWSTLDTAGRLAAITSLIADGKTDLEMAAALDTTKGAIIGLRSRQNIDPAGHRRARPRFPVLSAPPAETWVPLGPPTSSPSRKECCWPVGDESGARQMFCGLPKARGSYCTDHAAMAYAPRREDVAYSEMLMGPGRPVAAGLSADEAIELVAPAAKKKEGVE